MFEAKTATLSKKRVLLIENHPAISPLMDIILSSTVGAQFHLEHATDLMSGLERLQIGYIDLVLVDLSLPDSEGRETFNRVHELVPHVPIIVLSSRDDEELAAQTVQDGAQDYLVKEQLDPRLLLRSMRYAVKRKQAEAALSQERDLLHTLLNNTSDRIYFKDLKSRFLRLNPALAAHFKLADPQAAIGKSDFDFFTAEHAQLAYADEQRIIKTGEPVIGIVEKETHPDGRVTWAFTSKMPVRDKQGRVTGTFGISRDITEIKKYEEQLTDTNAQLRQSREEVLKALTDLKAANAELRATQFQLIQAAKLESIGGFAAGVAHEVKNPLQTILMGIDYLSSTEPNETETAVLTDMRDALRRADSIARDLLDFSRAQQLEVKPEDLNAVIEKALGLINYELTRCRITLVKNLAPFLEPVRLDWNKMQQVFINLFMNAIHAMRSGASGMLEVKTAPGYWCAEDSSPRARPLQFAVGDPIVTVEVCDNGSGIPEANLGRIFDPFFTTKPSGQGTGLGLPVSRSIVEMHSGTMDIQNRAEGGVRVQLRFRTEPTPLP
jgi:PAS domain S-box-containing protein